MTDEFNPKNEVNWETPISKFLNANLFTFLK